MKDTLIHIISSIVEEPAKVSVEENQQEGMIQFIVTVAATDMGKIIGKEGKVIRAIRNVMKIPAIKENKRISISLSENPS